eukprot:851673-Rhodomonas_salina.1
MASCIAGREGKLGAQVLLVAGMSAESREVAVTRVLNAHWPFLPVLRCRSKQKRSPEKSPSRADAECSLVTHTRAA